MSVQSPAKPKRPWWIWVVAAVALLGICGTFASMSGDTKPASTSSSTGGGLTMAAFNKVTPGMDCAKLPDIFGGPGELTAESNTGGLHIQSFDWKSTGVFDIAVVTVMCQNGKVDTKAQTGLK